MDNTANIAEARHLLAALEPHANRMRPSDLRFYEAWRSYLERIGDEARLNERRLTWLRNLWREYIGNEANREAA